MSKKALNVQDDSRRKGIQGNTSKSEIKCVCLNARSIINKKTELNIMVDDIKPHIIGITESWANNDITNAELGLEGYVMFRKDRIGRRGGGVLLYIKDTIPAYEVQLQEEADCNDAIWCNLVTGHTTVIIGVVYRCPNITKQNNEKIHNAINEVSKGDCIIMGDFNHGNIKWDTLHSTGVEDSTFLCLVQDNFLTQHVLEPTRAARVLDIVLSSQKEFVDNVVIQEPLGSSDHNQLHFYIMVILDTAEEEEESDATKKGLENSTEENRIGQEGQEGERRKSYSAAVIDGIKRKSRIFVGDSIVRKTDTRLSKEEDVVVCLPGARIEHVTERVEKIMGRGKGGTILVHIGTNNADKEGTTTIVDKYRKLLKKTKEARVEQIILSGILPVFGNRIDGYRNSKRMAINGMVKRLCKEEDVGYVDLWDSVVGKEGMYARDGLHLSRKGLPFLPRDSQGRLPVAWVKYDI